MGTLTYQPGSGSASLHEQLLIAQREHTTKRQAREAKRQRIALVHSRDDGERAMARRRRQIAAGSLTVTA